ncbi:hypothetical protein STENM223S_08064 [Streptomyces tendae]
MLGLRQERSTLLTSASNHTIRPGLLGAHLEGERVEAERAGEEVRPPRLVPPLDFSQLLHLRVGFAEPEHRGELDGDQARHPQPEPAGQFAGRPTSATERLARPVCRRRSNFSA